MGNKDLNQKTHKPRSYNRLPSFCHWCVIFLAVNICAIEDVDLVEPTSSSGSSANHSLSLSLKVSIFLISLDDDAHISCKYCCLNHRCSIQIHEYKKQHETPCFPHYEKVEASSSIIKEENYSLCGKNYKKRWISFGVHQWNEYEMKILWYAKMTIEDKFKIQKSSTNVRNPYYTCNQWYFSCCWNCV